MWKTTNLNWWSPDFIHPQYQEITFFPSALDLCSDFYRKLLRPEGHCMWPALWLNHCFRNKQKKTDAKNSVPQACPVPSAIIHKEFLVKTMSEIWWKKIRGAIFFETIHWKIRPHQQKWVEGPPPWHGLHPDVSQIRHCRPLWFSHSSHWRSFPCFLLLDPRQWQQDYGSHWWNVPTLGLLHVHQYIPVRLWATQLYWSWTLWRIKQSVLRSKSHKIGFVI